MSDGLVGASSFSAVYRPAHRTGPRDNTETTRLDDGTARPNPVAVSLASWSPARRGRPEPRRGCRRTPSTELEDPLLGGTPRDSRSRGGQRGTWYGAPSDVQTSRDLRRVSACRISRSVGCEALDHQSLPRLCLR